LVKVADVNKVEEVENKIKEMGFGAYSLADARNEMKKTMAVVQAILGASLGITNTMYMSIYERTKEIGIFKVLGCYLNFSEGPISAIINAIVAGAVPNMEGASISVIPLWLALAALAVAVLVGLLAGYFPSKRAMRLSALDAIRNE